MIHHMIIPTEEDKPFSKFNIHVYSKSSSEKEGMEGTYLNIIH